MQFGFTLKPEHTIERHLELTRHAGPCRNIAGSFSDGIFTRVAEKLHPGWSRFYARVLKEGTLRVGDRVRVVD